MSWAVRTVLLLFLWLASSAQAEWVKLRCYPKDCKVSLLRKGVSPSEIGSAREALELRPGQEILLQREGWESLRVVLPSELSDQYPTPPTSLILEAAESGGTARFLYHLKEKSVPLFLLLGVGAVLLWRRRSRPTLDREARLKELEDEILERGPHSMARLGEYRLLEPFNEGGMAVLYRAVPEQSLNLDETLAVKVLKRSFCDDAAYIKRWTREAKITSALEHPNLVNVRGAGEQDGIHYIAMELLEGQSLSSLVRPGGIPWPKAVALMLPVLDGLQAVHKSGITHRDLNPENILIQPDGSVQIIDFGIARGEDFTRATKTGVVLGVPSYLAPEQLMGQVDPASDQYAVGILLYELLSGSPPFVDPDPVQVMMQHSGRQVPPLEDVPAELDQIVQKMLAKKPELRFPDVTQARAALAALSDEQA